MEALHCSPAIRRIPRCLNPARTNGRAKKGSRVSPPRVFRSISPSSPLALLIASGRARSLLPVACSAPMASISGTEGTEVVFSETFPVKRRETVEGKLTVRLDALEGPSPSKWRLMIVCNLEGKWILHWGVSYRDDVGREWDQPPPEMRPVGSVPIKDYAVETPLRKSSGDSEGAKHEVQIDFDSTTEIAAINFVMKDEETGAWFQHKGRDFKIQFMGSEVESTLGGKEGFSIWSGAFEQLSSFLSTDGHNLPEDSPIDAELKRDAVFYEEYPISKEKFVQNSVVVAARRGRDADKTLVHLSTDIPGRVVVHWGVCRDKRKNWEMPPVPHPPGTKVFRRKALQTILEPKEDGVGNWGLFQVGMEYCGLLFVIKLNEYDWIKDLENDFYVPLADEDSFSSNDAQPITMQLEPELKFQKHNFFEEKNHGTEPTSPEEPITMQLEPELKFQENTFFEEKNHGTEPTSPEDVSVSTAENRSSDDNVSFSEGIINKMRDLVANISVRREGTKPIETRKGILEEIENLAYEAYNMFRITAPDVEEPASVSESSSLPASVCSGTGSGYEILCQGFNWESHKSGKWYLELGSKVKELSAMGFTIIWLPPPTDSVSPEGYMPRDLYCLNSRYGSMDELKELVKKFHEEGIKVLGDVVLNHRCAQYQNQNGIWNIFGGRLNWDDRAVVADDPHFQGRGNKSSGDNFHAAPNIDHSQDFVRNDLKEWLRWLRAEVGYDGWRLDFVRGFWGGYVKDYLEASEPYFAVGEYWDSLSYKYGVMDYNQDAHRQRIVDWINAANGTAGAFDVTTKGILHAALEKCEYWRLSDSKGKPPGVVGWWPSRAVTFIENHDTGSTQGHWRFPSGKEMQGYAYILTHPGTPTVFYDHICSHYQKEISELIKLRTRLGIHCRSKVKVLKAEKDVYAAEIDQKMTVKIGPGYYEPPADARTWSLAAEGADYKVWE